MPAYRFSWDAFDDRLVEALARNWDYSGDRQGARAWLSGFVKRPHDAFIRASKDVLVRTWLPEYDGAKQIVDRLLDAGIGPLGSPRSQTDYVRYVAECRNSPRLRQYLLESMLRFGDAAPEEGRTDGLEFTPRFAILEPARQQPDSRTPRTDQREAWNKLSAHFAESRSTGVFQGLLVMPTGSGKTYTAVRWLCEHVLNAGMKVLWLAHRHELLTHATREFHKLAYHAQPRQKLRVRAVSGIHCATSLIDPADDVVVASVGSLARRPDIARQILEDEKVFVVVDEAHHVFAKSYRDMIEVLQARKPWRILGLTATPTRTAEDERPVLSKLFGNRILHQIELRDLVEKGILARPRPVVVATDAMVEEGLTPEDREHVDRFNELSEEWLDRIANLAERNRTIISHYLANREKYGPTLMFAINVQHAALLAEELRNRGVKADYVASYRPDGTEANNESLIQQFREGQLDVLVNVQLVTEGVDIPRVATVFLTRPTNSEILMRQMIGRALRGPAAGGSRDAYLVSFADHWEMFSDWEKPFDLVPDIQAFAAPLPQFEIEPAPEALALPVASELDRFMDHLPWETIRAVAASIALTSAEHKADAFEAVPEGWLVVERTDEDQVISKPIAFYAHQRPCFEALLQYLKAADPVTLRTVDSEALHQEFFGDCDVPKPSTHHTGMLVQHFARGGEAPEFHDLKGRQQCDPYQVAQAISDRNLGRKEQRDLIDSSYNSLAKAIYPELREYQAAIDGALYELEHPGEATRDRKAVPVFDPRPDQLLAPGPTHDLKALLSEVLVTGAKLLDLPTLEYAGGLEWSGRLVKGWYGRAYFSTTPALIKLNRLLDSPDFSAETVRFLLWHEFLHVHLAQGHTKTFRQLERLWPTMLECDRELDTLNERFGVQYW